MRIQVPYQNFVIAPYKFRLTGHLVIFHMVGGYPITPPLLGTGPMGYLWGSIFTCVRGSYSLTLRYFLYFIFYFYVCHLSIVRHCHYVHVRSLGIKAQ